MRHIRNFVILFLLVIFLIDVTPVRAVDDLFAIHGCLPDPNSACLIPGDGVNTVIHVSLASQIVAQIAAKLFGANNATTNTILQTLGSLVPNGNYNIGTDKLNAFATQLETSTDTDLNLAELQSSEINDTTPKSAAMTSRACFYDQTGNLIGGDGIVSNDTINTANLPSQNALVKGAKQLASYSTSYVQESQNYSQPAYTMNSAAALPCPAKFGGGETVNQTPQTFTGTNTYGGGTILTSTVNFVANLAQSIINLATNNQTVSAKIVGTGLNLFAGHVSALFGGCATTADLNGVAYTTQAQKDGLCAAGGSANAMYRPSEINPAYNANNPNAVDTTQKWILSFANSQNTVPQPNSNSFDARIQGAADYTNCTITQHDFQSTAVPDGSCNQNWTGPGPTADPASTPITTPGVPITPTPSPGVCGTTLPTAPAAACGLCHTDAIKTMADYPSTVPEGIPPTMQNILTNAAKAYSVPASSLLAVMYHEGGFSAGRFVWSDANVKAWSVCGGQMPNCNENNTTTALYPFGLIPGWAESYKDAVLVDDPSRAGHTSLCNFMDAAYAAAKLLHADAGYGSLPNISEPTCFGSSMTTTANPSSCTDWNDNLVVKSHVFYGSYCPDPKIIAIRQSKGLTSQGEVAQPSYASWVLNWYHAFQCH